MKKRIDLFINSLRGGGAERVCTTLANGFVDEGYRVNLVVLNLDNSIYDKDLGPEVNLINLNKQHARSAVLAIASYLTKEKPEKVLVFNPQISIILILLRNILGLKFKIISRSINTLSKMKEGQKSIWHKYIVDYLFKKFYSKSDLIIAQSKGMKEDLIQNYNINPKKIEVIYNPVSQRIEETQKNTCINKRKTDKSNEILFVGRLSEQKGLQYLLKSFKVCVELEKDLKLRIVGEGPLEEQLKFKVKQMGLEEKVAFEGFKEDIIPYYLQADVTVLSSVFEGFPNVLVESISLGTPVVAFDCPSGPKEIIKDGKNGFIVRYLDEKDLSKTIIKSLRFNWDIEEIIKTSHLYYSKNVQSYYLRIL